nr:ATP-binding protein [Olegusella massiliensis]
MDLHERPQHNELLRLLRDIAKAQLVILNEFAYVPIDPEDTSLLFQAIDICYKKRDAIVIANIEFSKWDTVLGAEKLAGPPSIVLSITADS